MMDWSNERYVRLYTRDTVDWEMMPWESRALFGLLLRKVDRAGVLEMGRHGERGLAVALKVPAEVVTTGLVGLLDDGCIVLQGTKLVMRNFIEAQECSQSDAARKRAERERSRARAMSSDVGQTVTNRDADVTHRDEKSRAVTDGHTESLCAVPSLAVPSLTMREAVPTEPPPPSAPAVKPKRSRKKPATPPPVAGQEQAFAERWGIPAAHVEFAAFVDWHRANGKSRSDWAAAWRNWLAPKPWKQSAAGRNAVQPADADAPWLKGLA